jgi:hypothetical protein
MMKGVTPQCSCPGDAHKKDTRAHQQTDHSSRPLLSQSVDACSCLSLKPWIDLCIKS